MSQPGPYFHAWCDDALRIDALTAAVSGLFRAQSAQDGRSIDDVVASVRADFAASTSVSTGGCVKLKSGNAVNYDVECFRDAHKGWFWGGPLHLSPYRRRDVLRDRLEIAVSAGPRSVEIESAVLAIRGSEDIAEILSYLCAPDARSGVTLGACSCSSDWGAPVQACATYHSDAVSIASDLALSWIHIHDGDKAQHTAGMSMAALRARVEAAPPGASVVVAGSVGPGRSQLGRDQHIISGQSSSGRGQDIEFEGPAQLSRETVLRAIDMPSSTLLDALEASAVPDDEWRAVEASAFEALEAATKGATTYEVHVDSRKHVQFIERHAPYHVRRLPNGGVLLATHPYRTLWQLYADALFLLGITA